MNQTIVQTKTEESEEKQKKEWIKPQLKSISISGGIQDGDDATASLS